MFKQILAKISRFINFFLTLFIHAYRLLISPVLGNRCRFYPSCSQYAKEALKTQQTLIALWLIAKRLLKCHPWHAGGYDPVPEVDNKRLK